MRKMYLTFIFSTFVLLTFTHASDGDYEKLTRNFIRGEVGLESISVMTFGPEGILFLGDSKGGKIYALDLEDRQPAETDEPFELEDLEGKLGSLLGTDANGVLIHDLAVNPLSQNIYLAVSRADAGQLGFWKLPNDISYAGLLLKITPKGELSEVDLTAIRYSESAVPRLVEAGVDQNWRKSDLRTEAITDIAYDDGRVYIAGLSNEEFASALRVVNFPFDEKVRYSTIEVWHVAHGKSETESPIRTLLPIEIDGTKMILASYTCTPFVSIPVADLEPGKHVKSKTLAEFGFGNMPIDIIRYQKEGKEFLLMSNTSKALIRIDPEEIPKMKEGLTEPLKEGEYTVGLPHDVWSVTGVTQLDNFGANQVLLLQRMPNGKLNLRTRTVKWL